MCLPPSILLLVQIGPINLRFTVPMYNPSRIALKYLQIMKKEKNYNPYRWVSHMGGAVRTVSDCRSLN